MILWAYERYYLVVYSDEHKPMTGTGGWFGLSGSMGTVVVVVDVDGGGGGNELLCGCQRLAYLWYECHKKNEGKKIV